jgi:hypothetical protein
MCPMYLCVSEKNERNLNQLRRISKKHRTFAPLLTKAYYLKNISYLTSEIHA